MSLRRLADWDLRLTDFLAAATCRPTVWGEHDCALFCLGGVDAQAGTSHVMRFRGRYATPLQAASVIGPAGLGALAARIAGEIGLVPMRPRLAPRGSVIVYPGLRGETMGLLLGAVIVSPGDHGLVQVPAGLAAAAWGFC